MIKRLVIRNFQVHRRLSIDFDPAVTTIVGPSDVGKSAILRALKWVALNRPRGQSFITDGEQSARVELITDSGAVVRQKGERTNSYEVGGVELNAVGDEVPSEVSSLVRLGLPNFQDQHESPYWFGESAGEVSRQLNQIVNLEVMDRALAGAVSAVRKAKLAVEFVEGRVGEARADWIQYREVPRMVSEFGNLEALEQTLCDSRESRVGLETLVTRAFQCQKEWERSVEQLEASETVLALGETYAELSVLTSDLESLVSAMREQVGLAAREVPDISGLELLADCYCQLSERKQVLSALVMQVKEQQGEVDRMSMQLSDLRARFREEMGSQCPLCGQNLPS